MLSTIKNLVNNGTGSSKPKITRAQMLAAVPVRNRRVEWERQTRDDARPEVALLRIPRKSGKTGDLIARWFRLPEFRKLELDEIGSDVWEWCDGTLTVDALTRAVCAKYQLNQRQAEVSVAAYLKMLAERNLVALTAKRAGAVAAGSKTTNAGSAGNPGRKRKRA